MRLKPLLMGEMKNCTKSYINGNAHAGSIKISLISLGPVIFGDVESIISFLRGKGLLAKYMDLQAKKVRLCKQECMYQTNTVGIAANENPA